MAKKTRQKRRSVPARRPDASPRGGGTALRQREAPEGTVAGEAGVEAPAAGTAPAPARRGVQRIDPGARRRPAPASRAAGPTAAAGFAPLDPADAAIPFDRVPYVPADLRRVAVMAVIMVVLIVVANLVVSRITG